MDHKRRLLSSTSSHPARFNDKTLIKFNHFVHLIKEGLYDDDYTFELYDLDGNDQVIKKKYCDCYLVVDNGFLQWSVTVTLMKKSMFQTEIRYSQWLESMRKDVECTFGISKKADGKCWNTGFEFMVLRNVIKCG